MLTTINELFVFVPAGMGQTFIKRYATDEAYKKKLHLLKKQERFIQMVNVLELIINLLLMNYLERFRKFKKK